AFERDAPFERGARNREILQAAANEADDLIAAGFGPDEVRILLVMLQQTITERRQLEEVVFLGDGFGGASAIGTVVAGFGVVDVKLVEDAVLAGVAAFIDVPVGLASLEQPAHGLVMLRIGGADEVVVGNPERIPLRPEFVGDNGGELLRRFAGRLR